MLVRLVVNPNASQVTGHRRAAVERGLGIDHDVSVVETRHRADATALAAAAVADGVDAVAVLGGDGTLNEVANALVDTGCVLVPLPGGGTNVFCRSLGLPDDPGRAATEMGRALSEGAIEKRGVGSAGDRRFVIHAGFGWDAALVGVVEHHQRLKRRLGHSLYVYAGLRTFFADYDRGRPHLRLHLDGEDAIDGYFALVLVNDPYTFVGHRPFTVDPGLSGDRGLTVVVLRTLDAPRFLITMADALGPGLRDRSWLEMRQGLDSVEVERLHDLPYQVDGDHLGTAERLRVAYHPEALLVAVPS